MNEVDAEGDAAAAEEGAMGAGGSGSGGGSQQVGRKQRMYWNGSARGGCIAR